MAFLHISFKSGKVVIMLAGRFAGRKAVVVKTTEEGSGDKRFGHCVGEQKFLVTFGYISPVERDCVIHKIFLQIW